MFACLQEESDQSQELLAAILGAGPSEELELTANTLQAHMKPHGKLIFKPLIYLTAHS